MHACVEREREREGAKRRRLTYKNIPEKNIASENKRRDPHGREREREVRDITMKKGKVMYYTCTY